MNRGVIASTGTNSGHVHTLDHLADVEFQGSPCEGAILMFIDGRWRLASIEVLKAMLAS